MADDLAYHHFREKRLAGVLAVKASDCPAVAHDRYAVGHGKDFIELVADEDDGATLVTQLS